MVVNVEGPECLGFLPWQHCSLLASAERRICCVESLVFLLWLGFHLWNSLLSQVTVSVTAWSLVIPRSSLRKSEDPVLSVRLLLQRHVVASVAPTPELLTRPAKLSRYCETLSPHQRSFSLPCVWSCHMWFHFMKMFGDVEKTVSQHLLLLHYPFVQVTANKYWCTVLRLDKLVEPHRQPGSSEIKLQGQSSFEVV